MLVQHTFIKWATLPNLYSGLTRITEAAERGNYRKPSTLFHLFPPPLFLHIKVHIGFKTASTIGNTLHCDIKTSANT